MTDVNFYQLSKNPVEKALPALLEKVLASNGRAVIIAGSDERLEHLNKSLWTFPQQSFLPHGTKADGNVESQPVYLTTADENPNGANMVVLLDGMMTADLEKYDKCLILFDGLDEVSLKMHRGLWKDLKAANHNMAYYAQTDKGGWEKKQ